MTERYVGERRALRHFLEELRPLVVFAEPVPTTRARDALHERAHDACFLANSVTAAVVVVPRG